MASNNTLCFLDAYRARCFENRIDDTEYISHLVAHFDGRRHQGPGGQCEDITFEPLAGSLRKMAIEGNYQPMQGRRAITLTSCIRGPVTDLGQDTTIFAHLFKACLEHQDDVLKHCLREIEQSNPDVVPYQQLAVLAAREGCASILKLCIEKGAVFDRYLAKTARRSAGQFEGIREVTAPYEAIIAENTKPRRGPDGMYTNEQLQEWQVEFTGESFLPRPNSKDLYRTWRYSSNNQDYHCCRIMTFNANFRIASLLRHQPVCSYHR